jgi:mono/diheme cytochrome c family protein
MEGIGMSRACCGWGWTSFRFGASVLLLWLAGWAGAASAGERGPAAVQTPAALYHNYCSVCHGDQGDGNSRARGSLKPPPRDFTTPQAMQEMTRERMIAAVTTGVPGTAMVPLKKQLTDAQIASVVDYVRDTFMRASLAPDASHGRQIYAKSCSVCHGDRGTGSMWASANLRPPPRDFAAPQARAELTRERMIASVAAGRPGTAMAGYASQLSADDIGAVVDYVRGAFMRIDAEAGISGSRAHGVAPAAPAAPVKAAAAAPAPALPAVTADMRLPLPQGLRGDIAAGRKFYDANCATCHGTKGDGQGPRAYFINPKPRSFVTAESRALFNRPAIYAGVSAGRRGTEMPAWDKVLAPQQMADVSEYLFRSFIRPGTGSDVARRP